jgi:hypothetical protein
MTIKDKQHAVIEFLGLEGRARETGRAWKMYFGVMHTLWLW